MFPGLWRGCTGIIARTAVGSSAQLATFSNSKIFLMEYKVFKESLFLTALFASAISGFVTCVFMTPFDTVATRIFNQGEWKLRFMEEPGVSIFFSIFFTNFFYNNFEFNFNNFQELMPKGRDSSIRIFLIVSWRHSG